MADEQQCSEATPGRLRFPWSLFSWKGCQAAAAKPRGLVLCSLCLGRERTIREPEFGSETGMNAAAVDSWSAVRPARLHRPRVWYQARRFIPGLPEPARLQQCHHINVPTSP